MSLSGDIFFVSFRGPEDTLTGQIRKTEKLYTEESGLIYVKQTTFVLAVN